MGGSKRLVEGAGGDLVAIDMRSKALFLQDSLCGKWEYWGEDEYQFDWSDVAGRRGSLYSRPLRLHPENYGLCA